MMRTSDVVVGVFEWPTDARLAIEDLQSAHFSERDIGLLTHDRDGDPDIKSLKEMQGTRADTGAALGGAVGAGGGALWALGVAAGVLPAIGPVIAGGLLIAVIASAATGAATGAIVGGLVGLGIGDREAAFYDEEFRKGRTIVVVRADDRAALAATVLRGRNARSSYVHQNGDIAKQIDERVS
jgi:hypothetical protein